VVSGFRGNEAFLGTISNYWTPKGRRAFPCLPFTVATNIAKAIGDDHQALFSVCGAEWAGDRRVDRFFRIAMDRQWFDVLSHQDALDLERRLVEFVQHGQRRIRSIGKNCITALTANTRPIAFRCLAYSADGRTSPFMPNVITEHLAIVEGDVAANGMKVESQFAIRIRKQHDGLDVMSFGTSDYGPVVRIAGKVDVAMAPDTKQRLLARAATNSKPRRFRKRPRRSR
jgi:hypothetical protein